MPNNKLNYYEILQVSTDATLESIRNSYRILAKKYHPDICQSMNRDEAEERLKLINEAYDVLSDSKKRKDYDKEMFNSQQVIISPINGSRSSPSSSHFTGSTSQARKSSFNVSSYDDLNHYYNEKSYNYRPNDESNITQKLSLVIKFGVISIIVVIVVFAGVYIDKEIKEWKAKSTNNQLSINNQEKSTVINESPCITIGNNKEQVREILGNPTAVGKGLWLYNKSKIFFNSNNNVIGWSIDGKDINVFIYEKITDAPPIKTGSTKLDVKKAMGTPSYLYFNVWKYGQSEIHFDKQGKVIKIINKDKNLKLAK